MQAARRFGIVETMLLVAVVFLIAACSGARGKESKAPTANKAKPCDKSPDAGGPDAPASSYYQIGTCPDDESTP